MSAEHYAAYAGVWTDHSGRDNNGFRFVLGQKKRASPVNMYHS